MRCRVCLSVRLGKQKGKHPHLAAVAAEAGGVSAVRGAAAGWEAAMASVAGVEVGGAVAVAAMAAAAVAAWVEAVWVAAACSCSPMRAVITHSLHGVKPSDKSNNRRRECKCFVPAAGYLSQQASKPAFGSKQTYRCASTAAPAIKPSRMVASCQAASPVRPCIVQWPALTARAHSPVMKGPHCWHEVAVR